MWNRDVTKQKERKYQEKEDNNCEYKQGEPFCCRSIDRWKYRAGSRQEYRPPAGTSGAKGKGYSSESIGSKPKEWQ